MTGLIPISHHFRRSNSWCIVLTLYDKPMRTKGSIFRNISRTRGSFQIRRLTSARRRLPGPVSAGDLRTARLGAPRRLPGPVSAGDLRTARPGAPPEMRHITSQSANTASCRKAAHTTRAGRLYANLSSLTNSYQPSPAAADVPMSPPSLETFCRPSAGCDPFHSVCRETARLCGFAGHLVSNCRRMWMPNPGTPSQWA